MKAQSRDASSVPTQLWLSLQLLFLLLGYFLFTSHGFFLLLLRLLFHHIFSFYRTAIQYDIFALCFFILLADLLYFFFLFLLFFFFFFSALDYHLFISGIFSTILRFSFLLLEFFLLLSMIFLFLLLVFLAHVSLHFSNFLF